VSGYQRRGAHYRPAVEVAHEERHVRTRGSLSVFAAFACTALVGVSLASPHVPSQAEVLAPSRHVEGQSLAISVDAVDAVTRDGFSVTRIVTAKRAPAAGTPDPGTAQAIALEMVTARGWGSSEFDCLVALWNRESHWNVYSLNTGSGAYGIPQAARQQDGERRRRLGDQPRDADHLGPRVLSTGRYGTPCGAWNHSQATGWY
jgi:hypothetical protein